MKGETLEEGAQEVARALTHRRLGCADRSRSHMCVCVYVLGGMGVMGVCVCDRGDSGWCVVGRVMCVCLLRWVVVVMYVYWRGWWRWGCVCVGGGGGVRVCLGGWWSLCVVVVVL